VNGDAGNDTITLDSTATGKFTVNGGEGNDTINVKSKR
jgi:Ca2+-binding RTX toxin-like protein